MVGHLRNEKHESNRLARDYECGGSSTQGNGVETATGRPSAHQGTRFAA